MASMSPNMDSTMVQPGAMEPHRHNVNEILVALHTDARSGLSHGEAHERLQEHGRNELTAKKPVPAWRKLLRQFTDVLVVLLLIAALVSAGLWLYERESALPYEAMA